LALAYLAALEELAQLYLDSNHIHQCLLICQLALEQNRFQEVIYQVEMRAYAALGDRVSIARRYQACKAALDEGLGLSPSEETELIYRELTG
jgi:LuxR family transcriptional regulator, maltose regulon positive regulatory protein